jgi:hypothetical protein
MAPEVSRLLKRQYELPSDGEYMILGPYFKDEERSLAEYPKGTTCWFVIVKWRGLELFVAAQDPAEAMVAAANRVLKLDKLQE